jgi:CRP-like cAMP-binding protein
MHPVVRKLSTFANLSPEEAGAIALAFSSTIDVPAHATVAREDDPPLNVFFVLDGLVCRHKALPNGRRQILSFMIPGDSCDVGVSVLERRDHSLTAIVPSQLARVSDTALEHLAAEYPRFKAALQWAALVEEAISREWIINLGQRSADARMAHLICELYYRMRSIGLIDGYNYALPLTQNDLGDALGLSTVHINRTLQDLRHGGLIAFGDRRMTILNLAALLKRAEFDPTYLHLEARYAAARRI